jgi:glycosyltransferase involved in cell wall biosynthesis
MTNEKPLISIGMPVYNEEKYISESIQSLLAQTFEDFELIISDNASQDRTQEICLEFASKDKRIRYVRNEKNRGQDYNFRRVFELSSGAYFMWAAGHDLWHPEYLDRARHALDNNPNVLLCYPQVVVIDEQGNENTEVKSYLDTRYLGLFSRYMVYLWSCLHPFIIHGLARSKAYRQVNFSINAFNAEFILFARLSLLGEIMPLEQSLYFFRHTRAELRVTDHFKRYSESLFTKPLKRVPLLLYWRCYFQSLTIPWATHLGWGHKVLLTLLSIVPCLHKYGPCMVQDVIRLFRREPSRTPSGKEKPRPKSVSAV